MSNPFAQVAAIPRRRVEVVPTEITPEQASIDTGDHVYHSGTGEDWLVAYVEDGKLCACGWPLTVVPLVECALRTRASEGGRLKLLHDMAAMSQDDPRKRYAQRRLETIERTET